MPDPRLSQAIAEAYAAAPVGEIEVHTLELWHPTFVEDGQPKPIRVARVNHAPGNPLTARLEPDAPRHPGELVAFVPLAFDLRLPPKGETPVPELVLTLDNVGREISDALTRAAQSLDAVTVIYRPYLESRLEVGPEMLPPPEYELSHVSVTPRSATGRARQMDLMRRAFPYDLYDLGRFPTLRR